MEHDPRCLLRRRAILAGGAVVLGLVALLGLCLALRPFERRFVDGDQSTAGAHQAVLLTPGATAGQTFVARHAGLAGMEIWLAPSSDTPLTVTLHLRSEPSSTTDLTSAAISLPAGAAPGYFRFSFPPRADSLGRYYYACFEASREGASLALANGAAYLDGAAYRDGEPLDAQAAFHLVYAPGPLLLDLLGAAVRALALVGVVVFLLVIPGWALLAWLGPARGAGWGEKLGLSAGIGLAVLPLLVLWTDVAGIHLGAGYAWLPAGVGAPFLAWQAWRLRRTRSGPAAVRWWRSQNAWPDILLVVGLTLIVVSRLLAVRTVDVPLWGDGYQHTMIVQLLVDHGGLFDSWQPYSAIDRFTYHFGFHSLAAAVHWLTGLPVPQAVLWTGQMLNVLAVLALFPLAVRVGKSRWSGVVCVLVAGLLSPMPSQYVNWGRYTQLAGQVILPAAAWLTWELVEATGRQWRLTGLVALVAGGLAITHYRVLAFYAVFVVALLPFFLRRQTWRRTLLHMGAAWLGAALLFLPWLVHTFEGAAIRILGKQLTTMPAQVGAVTRATNEVNGLDRYLAPGWWVVLLCALGWAALRRRTGPLVIAVWSALMVLAANPAWLGLPGTGAISNFAIAIAVYIPAGLLVGFLAAEAIAWLPQWHLLAAMIGVVIVGGGLWGAQQRLRDLNPAQNAYVTRPDVRAAAWIRENTGSDAKFLVNSSPAYGGSSVVGTDGGWWLPLLAGRQNTVPPLNYATELTRNSGLRKQMELLARLEEEQGIEAPSAVAALRAAGVTHVYIDQRQGAVNDTTSVTLDPERLSQSGAYQLVYRQDRVWIFGLVPSGGQP